VDVRVEGKKSNVGTGPRSRRGQLSATFKVRQDGGVLPLLDVDFLPQEEGAKTLVRITDKRTGEVIFEEGFKQ